MRKSIKLTNIAVAALFAVSPVASTIFNTNVVTAAKQKSTNAVNVINHFLRNTAVYENGQKINAYASVSNIHFSRGVTTIDNSSTSQLINGKYRLSAGVVVSGFTPAIKDRIFNITNNSGDIIGSVSIPANSSIGQGGIDFEFNISNGNIGKTSLGEVTSAKNTTKSKKKATKKHTKKKHSKKSKKRHAKSHKKAKRHSKRRK